MLQVFGCGLHIISSPLFRQLLQWRQSAMLEGLSALSTVIMWWAQCKALDKTPQEYAMHCAACSGSVRGLGWSWLDVSKRLFCIYLSEALISHPFLLVQAHGECSSQCRFLPCTKSGHWATLSAKINSGRVVFYPRLVQWLNSCIVLPSQRGWCGSRLTRSRDAQPAAAAYEFCLWYSPATISIHCAV